jgi:hypothetical protein
MHRIGKGLEDTCRLCMEESETAQHVMCECPAVARNRLERFHGIKKPVKIITFIVGIREPTMYVTILFAEYKITLSKSD